MRDRTADPLLAKQVLSQLSYTPIFPLSRVENCGLKIDYSLFILLFSLKKVKNLQN